VGALVAVLDQQGVKTLFGSDTAPAVGKTIRIGDMEYEIVGVAKSDGSYDESTVTIYTPFTTNAQRVVGDMSVVYAMGLAREGVEPQTAADATSEWLAKRFRIPEEVRKDVIYVTTMKSIIDQMNALMGGFQAMMTAVASISLLVGGIGIMNMMLTNVTERIREIGLRKALGARRRDITRQFLLESVCLTMVGGALGMLLGYVSSFGLVGLASGALGADDMSITPSISLESMLMVAGICVAIGVVFGYYPARRAAKLDPVESLHYQ
jgi:putative ABC transport system permease protein